MLDRSLILGVAAQLVVPTALLFSAFLLFAGHNQPGGGFIGGLVAGAAVVLLSVERRRPVALATTDVPYQLLGLGLLVALGTALAPLPLGGNVLESGKVEADLPVLGHLKVTSALAFDVGVYLVVVGLVLVLLGTLGGQAAEEVEEA